ncbi:MAG: hypothetical protein ABH835_03850 [Patescibacteria group bacterium]
MNFIDILLIVIAIIVLIMVFKFVKKIVFAVIGLVLLVILVSLGLYYLSQWEPAQSSAILNYIFSSRIGSIMINSVSFIFNIF